MRNIKTINFCKFVTRYFRKNIEKYILVYKKNIDRFSISLKPKFEPEIGEAKRNKTHIRENYALLRCIKTVSAS